MDERTDLESTMSEEYSILVQMKNTSTVGQKIEQSYHINLNTSEKFRKHNQQTKASQGTVINNKEHITRHQKLVIPPIVNIKIQHFNSHPSSHSC